MQSLTKSTVFKMTSREVAFRWSQWVILGDDGLFWVVTPADFERLIRVGYEAAK